MSITNELRKWVLARFWDGTRDSLLDIADRIDKEHKDAIDKAHADGERNGLQQARSASEDWRRGFDAGFASADGWLTDHEDAMAEHGWVRLPVDADGRPIHVGDVMVDSKTPRPVLAITSDSIVMGGYPETGEQGMRFGTARNYRHHHEPTTEDVLREFAL